uniref:nuclear pore complex protein NUP50A-like n=1 Tax=Erigeron canadensis TaxID=72917 RepID=UPI001CB9CE20|nr:nuclear pore complex protein NUP50A-like [Erigeron canadensis]
MGDAENTLPPTKKRAAGRELSRDNPGLDDEEEVPGQETGTFKRASEEVLANRRIVRVKRSQPSSNPSAPTSNPFAAIRLVPPTESTPTSPLADNLIDTEKPAAEELESPKSVNKEPANEDASKQPEPNNSEAEKEGNENKDKLVGDDVNTSAPDIENDENKDKAEGNGENTPATEKENDENTPATGSVNSFQQLSSSQNAFTGLVGTGFSSSTFSFGTIPKTDQPTFPSFSFGTNGNSSLFATSDKTEGSKIPTMQEVQVETGEENEKAVFTADSILFEFLDGGWKERGKGELKVNVLTTGTKKARLVMRARGNYRLILNASIFPDMKLTNMEKKGITFACMNSTGEGQKGLSTFALKFRDPSYVEEFRSVVMAHKGNTTASTLKTPENSPKASDE